MIPDSVMVSPLSLSPGHDGGRHPHSCRQLGVPSAAPCLRPVTSSSERRGQFFMSSGVAPESGPSRLVTTHASRAALVLATLVAVSLCPPRLAAHQFNLLTARIELIAP